MPDDFEGFGDSTDFAAVDFADSGFTEACLVPVDFAVVDFAGPAREDAGFEVVVTFDDTDFPDDGFDEDLEACVAAEADFGAVADFAVDFDTGFDAEVLVDPFVAVTFTAVLAPDDFEAGFAATASFFFLTSFFAIKTYHLSKLAKPTQNDSVVVSSISFGAFSDLSAPLISDL